MKKFAALMLSLFLFSCGGNGDVKGSMYYLEGAPTDMEVTLVFDKDTNNFYGQAVNNYFGSYELDGSSIKFSPSGATMMAAPEEMMNFESKYFADLEAVNSIETKGNTMTLRGSNVELKFSKLKQ